MNRKAKKVLHRHFASGARKDFYSSLIWAALVLLLVAALGILITQSEGRDNILLLVCSIAIFILSIVLVIIGYQNYRNALKACEPYLYLTELSTDELDQHIATLQVEKESIEKSLAEEKQKYEAAVAEPKRIYEAAIEGPKAAYLEAKTQLEELLEQGDFETAIYLAKGILNTHKEFSRKDR